MSPWRSAPSSGVWLALCLCLLQAPRPQAHGQVPTSPSAALKPTLIKREAYHGWSDAIILSNGLVEVVVVPQIGRLMQFRFQGEIEGVFWENPALRGQPFDANAKEWLNFGGDKSWPAQQKDWPTRTGRSWPPPATFDGLPVTVSEVVGSPGVIELASQVDPHWGIRETRRVELLPGQAVMRVLTKYEKVSGPPVSVGVWVITQLQDPLLMAAASVVTASEPMGFKSQSKDRPSQLKSLNGMISLQRDAKVSSKIGLPTRSMVWVGDEHLVKIDGQGAEPAGAIFPDEGSKSEIYTNPDPLPYVELETLGPYVTLKPGESTSRANIYKLFRREKSQSAEKEARRRLGLPLK